MAIELPFAVIPLDLGTITTGNELASRPAVNLNRPKFMGMTWKTSGATNVWVRGDIGSIQSIDFISMIGANALAGTKIRVRLGTTQAQVDGTAPYDSGTLDFISPSITREDGLYHSHLQIPTPQSAQWWRIDITSHTGDFEAAALIIGKRITPTRFYDADFEYGVEDTGSMDINSNGVVSEVQGVVLRTLNFTLSWLSEAEFETKFRPMVEKLGVRGINYWCFDPGGGVYRQARTYLGFFKTAPFARGSQKPRTFAKEFQIISLI